MNEINFPYDLSNGTDEESDYISHEVMHSNNGGVPLVQKKAPILKRYVLKDNDEIIAGINASFVAEGYRHKQLGNLSHE